jgi:hypothetical protein
MAVSSGVPMIVIVIGGAVLSLLVVIAIIAFRGPDDR